MSCIARSTLGRRERNDWERAWEWVALAAAGQTIYCPASTFTSFNNTLDWVRIVVVGDEVGILVVGLELGLAVVGVDVGIVVVGEREGLLVVGLRVGAVVGSQNHPQI